MEKTKLPPLVAVAFSFTIIWIFRFVTAAKNSLQVADP
jgi:hypothetical protein